MDKILKTLILITCLLLGLKVSSSGERNLYLVTKHHPRIIESIKKIGQVEFEKGRVLVVSLNKGLDLNSTEAIGRELKSSLRSISKGEFLVYRPAPGAVKKKPRHSEWVNETNEETFVGAVESLTQIEDRSSRGLSRQPSSGNLQAQEYLLNRLKSYGLEPQLHCYYESTFGKECNVVAVKSGAEGAKSILVQAHFDDVGYKNAGADDNASGSSALLTMSEMIASSHFEKNIYLLFTNGEETGLNGSRAFVKKLKKEGQLSSLEWTLNMDMVGYNKNGIFEIETNKEYKSEAEWMATMAHQYTQLTPEITIPAWGSDHETFLRERIPSFLTIEDWQTKTPCYHRPCDKKETLNIEYAMQIIRLNLALVAEKAIRVQ